MLDIFKRRLVFLGLLLILVAVIIACGEEATTGSRACSCNAKRQLPADTPAPAATAARSTCAPPQWRLQRRRRRLPFAARSCHGTE